MNINEPQGNNKHTYCRGTAWPTIGWQAQHNVTSWLTGQR